MTCVLASVSPIKFHSHLTHDFRDLSWFQALASDLTSGCGTMQQCFRRPEGCVGSACDYSVAFCPRGDYVDFTVGVSIGDDVGPNFYLAFGVNETPERVRDPIIYCHVEWAVIMFRYKHDVLVVASCHVCWYQGKGGWGKTPMLRTSAYFGHMLYSTLKILS